MRIGLKKWIRYLVSLILAVGLLALLLSRQRWGEVANRISRADVRYLLLAAVIAVLYWTVRSGRWRWIISLENQQVSFFKAVVSMLAGLGVGLVTPLRSGEIIRPLFVPKGARIKLAGWIVIERMFDLSAVLTWCIIGLFYLVFSGVVLISGEAVSPWLLIIAPLLLAGALGVPLLVHYRPAGLWRILSKVLPGKAKELAQTRLQWNQFGIFYSISLVSEMLSILSVFCCLRAFGDISLLQGCALTPVVMLHNLLPATPGGFGVREGVAVLVFGAFGFPSEMILAAYLANAMIVLVIPAAIGIVAAWVSGVVSQITQGEAE